MKIRVEINEMENRKITREKSMEPKADYLRRSIIPVKFH